MPVTSGPYGATDTSDEFSTCSFSFSISSRLSQHGSGGGGVGQDGQDGSRSPRPPPPTVSTQMAPPRAPVEKPQRWHGHVPAKHVEENRGPLIGQAQAAFRTRVGRGSAHRNSTERVPHGKKKLCCQKKLSRCWAGKTTDVHYTYGWKNLFAGHSPQAKW